MEWYQQLLSWLLASLVVVFGWLVGHRQAMDRDRTNKQRDLRLRYLIENYRKLDESCDRGPDESWVPVVASVLSDIQLFGTPRQIELAATCTATLCNTKHTDLNDLLQNLRNDLRQELQLGHVDRPIVRLRRKPPEKAKN